MTGPHYNLHGDGQTSSRCKNCGTIVASHLNYCDWDCHVAAAKAAGARVHTPNGLPVKSISGTGLLLEHLHGDHPDYRFPVDVVWMGPDDHSDFTCTDGNGHTEPLPPNIVEWMKHEQHALIYSDGAIALTIHDTSYALWDVHGGGRCRGGHHRDSSCWRIEQPSCQEIQRRTRTVAESVADLGPGFRLLLGHMPRPHSVVAFIAMTAAQNDGPQTCGSCSAMTTRRAPYCSLDCHIEAAKKAGGRLCAPNGLPIRVVRDDHTMLEHEYADHPDYKFPVTVEWIGPGDQLVFWEGQRRPAASIEGGVRKEHALVYADRHVALTLRLSDYCMWSLRTGTCVAGWSPKNWRLSDAARQTIRRRIPGATESGS